MNLQRELDRSFGEGPSVHRPVADLIAGGRRLRRRRRWTAAAGAGLSVVLAGAVVVGPLASRSGDGGRALAPAVTATAVPTGQSESSWDRAVATFKDWELEADGSVPPRAGVEIRAVIKEPLKLTPPSHSRAVVAVLGEEVYWVLLTRTVAADGTVDQKHGYELAGQSAPDIMAWIPLVTASDPNAPTP